MSDNPPSVEPASPAPHVSQAGRRRPSVQWILNHFPPGQFGRYLAVGLVNTAFGYGTYAGLTALLTPHVRLAYVVASIVANFLAITFSFLNYKWFVFKTSGHYLREWWRCMLVYGGTGLLGTAVLPVMVFLVRRLMDADRSAPYIAFALVMGANTLTGFLGHKNFSFAAPKRVQDRHS